MNLLFLTHRLPYAPNRGDRIRAYHLLREMSRFARVSLFSLVHDTEERDHVSSMPFAAHVGYATVPLWTNRARALGALATSSPVTHALLSAPGARSEIERLVSEQKPDVVIAYCSSMARYALEAPLADMPMVLDMVDVDSAKWRDLGDSGRGPRAWVYRHEAQTLRRFEAVAASVAKATLVVNDREAQTMHTIAPGSAIHVVPNGVDLEAFRPTGPPADGANVIFCGVLDYVPNAEGLRWFAGNVWPLVRQARQDARLTIVGSGSTTALGGLLEDRSIEIVGRVPEVQPYLWKSAVAIAPLHLARGLQNKVLEALAAGLPVVATPQVQAGLPFEVAPACIIADEAHDFASAVVRVLNLSPHERRAMAAQAGLSGLDWPERFKDLQPIIERAAQARRA